MVQFTLSAALLALSSTRAFANPFNFPLPLPEDKNIVPMQTRLAYAGSEGMMVSWNTYKQLDRPTVYYGLFPFALFWTATSNESVTYPSSTTYNNHVKIENLRPNTKYYYLPQHANTTTPYSFTTGRTAGDHTAFVAAGTVDLGTMGNLGLSDHVPASAGGALAPGERNTIQALAAARNDFELLLHPGDIAYADAVFKEEGQGYLPNTTAQAAAVYEEILNAFYDEMEPITANIPYMVGPGNHEANCINGGYKQLTTSICVEGQKNFTGYRNHFRMPSKESGGVENFWYSFDHGMAHFVVVDTENDLGEGIAAPDGPTSTEASGPFAPPNTQINWLKGDLAAVDRKKTPWVIVTLHRPWYSSGSFCAACQTALEDIIYNANVDLVYTGHFHVTERMAPIYKNKIDPNELNNPRAPWYIVNGAGGHYSGLDAFSLPLQSYSRYAQNSTYGYSRFEFHNATHLTHNLIASKNGTVLDSATLFKQH